MSNNIEQMTRLTQDVLTGRMQDLYIENAQGFQIHPNYINPYHLGINARLDFDSPWDTRRAALAAYTLRWVSTRGRATDDYDPDAVVDGLFDINGEDVAMRELEIPQSLGTLQLMGLVEVDLDAVKATRKSIKIMTMHPDQTPTVLPPRGRLFHGFRRASKANTLYTRLLYGEEAWLETGKATMSRDTYARRRDMRTPESPQED